ncbi:DNA packaging tegument protein UL17 [Saimiriine betaherpesvirus 4]|uniref:DNA packaging tegument protein UL17 n=1 Tax=Saimiriine betaherpesvirus 4 TaxID=1535247 RepID=G8XSZ7_9BETA|nr:DNA packaging tegument protein UL17 [Saimiriine betaherpesvirus 4]AEV80944.1 DNA packaging tegument protein UL17 [Saimiriine betaherpesvirus 4]
METHLFSDLDFQYRFDSLAQVPIHLVFDETVLTLEKLSQLVGVYFKTEWGQDWQRALFTVVPRRWCLRQYLDQRGLKSPDVKIVCQHAVFTTIGVSCVDRVILGGRLVYVRFVLNHRQSSVAAENRRSFVDCEFFVRDLLKGRHFRSQEEASSDRLVLPVNDRPFFEIPHGDARSKIVGQQLLLRSGVTEQYTGGALEPPSKIRGYELSKRPEVENPDILYAFGENEGRIIPWTEEWESGGVVGIQTVWDVSAQVRVHVLWYQRSFWNSLKIDYRDEEVDIRQSLETYRRHLVVGSSVFENIYRELRVNVAERRAVRQLFDCFVSADLDPSFLWEMACASLDLWIYRVEKESCIIKALTTCLQQSRDVQGFRQYRVVGQGGRREAWADVIYNASGRVDLGLQVSLEVCSSSGLWRTKDRHGYVLDWVANPEVCVIYATSHLDIYWILPGGFGTVLPIPVHGVDLGLLYERFKTPEVLFTT